MQLKAQKSLCSANQSALSLPISTNHITQDRKFPIFQKITGKMYSEPALTHSWEARKDWLDSSAHYIPAAYCQWSQSCSKEWITDMVRFQVHFELTCWCSTGKLIHGLGQKKGHVAHEANLVLFTWGGALRSLSRPKILKEGESSWRYRLWLFNKINLKVQVQIESKWISPKLISRGYLLFFHSFKKQITSICYIRSCQQYKSESKASYQV